MTENNKIETKEISLNDYKEMMAKMKAIEKELKEKNPEEFKKIKELKKAETKARPEKAPEYELIRKNAKAFITENLENIEKVFRATITEKKVAGQKWVVFSLGDKYSLGVINNKIKPKKE